MEVLVAPGQTLAGICDDGTEDQSLGLLFPQKVSPGHYVDYKHFSQQGLYPPMISSYNKMQGKGGNNSFQNPLISKDSMQGKLCKTF